MSAVKFIEIGGEKRPVRFDVNSFCEFEEITGKNMLHGLKGIDARGARALVYVGLQGGHDEKFPDKSFPLTLKDVGRFKDLLEKTPEFIKVMREQSGGDGAESKDQSSGE